MTMRAPLLFAMFATASGVASADAPPTAPRPTSTTCAGPSATRACAMIDRRARRTTITRAGRKGDGWIAPVAPPAVIVRPDGRLIAEDYRPGGLVSRSDGPATVLVVLRGRGGAVAHVTLGDVAPNLPALPATVSHRQWSIARFFDRDGDFVAELADGRRLRITPAGVKSITAAADDRPPACRYAEPDPNGPCARR